MERAGVNVLVRHKALLSAQSRSNMPMEESSKAAYDRRRLRRTSSHQHGV
jgi:hypothetical protein